MQSGEIVVSISCIAYNHAPYIRQCLDGFMMQQTNFAFEVLIHDDASTDGTTEIIKEYEREYPDIIKPIYEEENQWIKGRRGSAVFNFPRAKGKYIAMCEGDDYWTDPLKLQKQVDYMNANLDTVLCSHSFVKLIGKTLSGIVNHEWANKRFYLDDLIRGEWPLQTATILFRKELLSLSTVCKFNLFTETSLVYLLLKNGSGYVLSDKMSIYRESPKGVWSGLDICDQWAMVANVRLDIYKVEQSIAAAELVLQSSKVGIGRYAYIKHYKTTLNILSIMIRYRGVIHTLKWLMLKFIFGKELNN